MARLCAVAATAVAMALLLAVADARYEPSDAVFGRSLQALDCSRIRNCTSCRNQRIAGVTTLVCTACANTYKVAADFRSCQCAPGYYRTSDSTPCVECATGSWCPGGDNSTDRNACGTGLTTLIATASRDDQCVTLAGYGFDGTSASTCATGTFSSGKTRNPCRACGNGLTTDSTGASSFGDCLAPPGYYLDKSSAKPCPRGTYTIANNRQAVCSGCGAGVTTAVTGSTSPNDCSLAKPGYFMTGATTADKCARNFYQPQISTTTTCVACATNMITVKKGSATRTACVAPAGYEYKNDTVGATACVASYFKTGNNRRACVACGTGFSTTGTAKTSFADCYIPQGWGTSKVGAAWVAAQCAQGFYGAKVDTFGVRNLPCTPCPAGMTTPTAFSVGPADCVTLPGYGYDAGSQTAKQCDSGTYSPGGDRNECIGCGEGFTSAPGSDAAADCYIAPGYGYTGADTDPEPCPKGTYSEGGVNANCTTCPTHYTTTASSLAESVAECDACEGGYGGDTCTICASNTYNPGDSKTCTSCAATFQSPEGSDGADDCLARWNKIPVSTDVITFDAAGSYVTVDAASDATACQTACDGASGCMYYAWDNTNSKCSLVNAIAAGGAKIGFKSASGVFNAGKYTVWAWDEATPIGSTLVDPATATATTDALCTAVCDTHDECIAVVFGAACTLIQTDLDQDVTACQYKAVGQQMNKW